MMMQFAVMLPGVIVRENDIVVAEAVVTKEVPGTALVGDVPAKTSKCLSRSVMRAMQYRKIVPARFISRHNRFIAKVNVNGQVETVHVKNTGCCKELLLPESNSSTDEREAQPMDCAKLGKTALQSLGKIFDTITVRRIVRT